MSDDSSWTPAQEETTHEIIRFDPAPREPDAPQEPKRWLKWVSWLKEHMGALAVHASGLSKDFARAKVAQEEEKAKHIASRTEYLDAQTEGLRLQNQRNRISLIDEAIGSDNPLAEVLKLNLLASQNPELADQLNKVQELGDKLRIQHGFAAELLVNLKSSGHSSEFGRAAEGHVSSTLEVNSRMESSSIREKHEESSPVIAKPVDAEVEVGIEVETAKVTIETGGTAEGKDSAGVSANPRVVGEASHVKAETGKFQIKGSDIRFNPSDYK